MDQTTQILQQPAPKKPKQNTLLVTLLSVAIVLLIAILGLLAYNTLGSKSSDNAQPVADTTHVAAAQPSAQPVQTQPETEAPKPEPPAMTGVNGDLYGNVGGMYVSFYMKGTSGYYDTSGGRRTLKLTSHNGNHVEINAYLKGRYIGRFSGTVSTIGGQLSQYAGKFYSSRGGAGLSFDLINPMD